MIAYLLEGAHKSRKSHLKSSEMGEYLSNKLNVFWSKMYEECECFCKDWESCQMFKKIKKRKRIVKYIRSYSRFERYQADTVELDSRITHNHDYPYQNPKTPKPRSKLEPLRAYNSNKWVFIFCWIFKLDYDFIKYYLRDHSNHVVNHQCNFNSYKNSCNLVSAIPC